MALEPATPSAEPEENPELVDMTRRFAGSLLLTLPVFGLAMGEMLPGSPLAGFSSRTLAWLQRTDEFPHPLRGGTRV